MKWDSKLFQKKMKWDSKLSRLSFTKKEKKKSGAWSKPLPIIDQFDKKQKTY
jgi:hypothetical protein